MTTNENISSSNPTNQANEPSEALLTAIGLRFCSSLTFKAISKEDMQAANLQADNATMDCLKKVLTVIKASKSDCWQLMNNPKITALPEELVDAVKVQAQRDSVELPTTEEAFQKKARLSEAELQEKDKQLVLNSVVAKLNLYAKVLSTVGSDK